MQRTGIANLPLHHGRAPRWLFQRMVKLSRAITLATVEEHGPQEMLRRLSDPHWFQALGCVLGFDWHSSGVTTTVCGALKEGLRGMEKESGLYVAGGKGKTSRKTPGEIEAAAEKVGEDLSKLVYASRMTAKVDTSALQDGYQLYHHTFFFTPQGAWAVVQQGMNETNRYARRYHWLGESVSDMVCEPHAAIVSQANGPVLNLVAAESDSARVTVAKIAAEERPESIIRNLDRLKSVDLPRHHHVALEGIHPNRIYKILLSTYERKPATFEGLLALEGVGPKTVRALSLVAELVYGISSSTMEPELYSFAHGGKDGYPYPVDRKTYDETVEFMSNALKRAKIGDRERLQALKRLPSWSTQA